jgi:hypothetical protein
MIASFFSRLGLCLLGSISVGAYLVSTAQGEEIEAVSSRVSADYVRAKLPDGSFQPETYAFAKGGYRSSGTQDYSIDKIQFLDVARTIAGPLATQRYIPAKDPKTTRLLVMVYWGATASLTHSSDSAGYQNLQLAQGALSSAQMDSHGMPAGGGIAADQNELDASLALVNLENHIRDRADAENAALLGYDSWWDKYSGHAVFGTALAEHKQEMIDELEEGRYFVVLMAYDFQLLLKEKKHKLLWETRFSVRQRGNEFDKQLEKMAQYASTYFGQDSHGLTHKPLPEGQVEIGDLKNLGVVPEK